VGFAASKLHRYTAVERLAVVDPQSEIHLVLNTPVVQNTRQVTAADIIVYSDTDVKRADQIYTISILSTASFARLLPLGS
jgi:hypothetical protein